MTPAFRVFVSSVQKELEDERVIVQNLVTTDPFLSAHCLPVLYEYEPASPDQAVEGCLKSLDSCQVYLLILDPPLISTDTGYFQVTFPGPGDDLDRIRVPEKRLLVTPAVEAQLSKRQREIMAYVLESGSVTTRWCMNAFGVVRDTAHRDLVGLAERGLLVRKGAGRGVLYVPADRASV